MVSKFVAKLLKTGYCLRTYLHFQDLIIECFAYYIIIFGNRESVFNYNLLKLKKIANCNRRTDILTLIIEKPCL